MKLDPDLKRALGTIDARLADWKQTLCELARIPSVSAQGFPREEVQRSARAFVGLLERCGLEHVQVLEIEGVHPYVYADWLHKPGAPTLILYGHHDVVPPGRPEHWKSPAFEPQERGGRLYGRGTADDKGGILVHVAAVAAYLENGGSLPCNVRFLIEGEEEIGSANLPRFLKAFPKLMQADAVVLSDTSNYDTGIPALTYRLRGNCLVDVEVRCLERPVHSGQKGGPVPDPVRILSGLIASLHAKDGSLAIPGLYDKVRKLTARERARIAAVPFDEARFRKSAAMLPGLKLAGEQRFSVRERQWARPSLTVIAFESHEVHGSSNQIVDAARARMSLRTVPDMDSQEAGELLLKKLTDNPPYDAKISARIVRAGPPWHTEPEGPAFDAARRALFAGFGKEAVMLGAGGSIGFVRPFADFLKGAPCLLTGVEDPACDAHSENESLHLGDWKKCMRAAVHLYHELSGVAF